jgi:hypothetical protein
VKVPARTGEGEEMDAYFSAAASERLLPFSLWRWCLL